MLVELIRGDYLSSAMMRARRAAMGLAGFAILSELKNWNHGWPMDHGDTPSSDFHTPIHMPTNEHPHHANDGNRAPEPERNADPGASTIDTLVSKYEHHAERDNDGAICNADVGSGERVCEAGSDGGKSDGRDTHSSRGLQILID